MILLSHDKLKHDDWKAFYLRNIQAIYALNAHVMCSIILHKMFLGRKGLQLMSSHITGVYPESPTLDAGLNKRGDISV